MEVLILNQDDVRQLLDMERCMTLVEGALCSLGRGAALNPLRSAMWLPDRRGLLGLMPGFLADSGALGVKVISVFPGNTGTPYPSHQGVVMLFEAEHGQLRALIDAASVTAIRTAAVSGVATRLLAREDASRLALLGSGEQAATHLDAMLHVRPIHTVTVWSRTPAHARRFAGEAAVRHGLPVRPCATAREAVADADLICTVTSAREPVLMGEWLRPGMHLNAVGASAPAMRELDTEAIRRARLFVDLRASALHEAGALRRAMAEGVVGEDHIVAEIGEVLLGEKEGRRGPSEITVFKSLGLAVEDLAPAQDLYHRALTAGIGQWVELGGAGHG